MWPLFTKNKGGAFNLFLNFFILKGVTKGYIDAIKDKHDGVETTIWPPVEKTSEFSVTIGFVSTINFEFFMHELTKHIHDYILWCMLFADDVVLIDGN